MELNIRSSVDLRNKYNEISKQCKETREREHTEIFYLKKARI